MKLPDMLKILRNAKSLTQQDAAKALKIRQYNLSDYETGRATPSIELLIKMADLYEVTLDDMLGREFKNTPYLSSTSSAFFILIALVILLFIAIGNLLISRLELVLKFAT